MTDKNPTDLQPTHEIYGYMDDSNEPVTMTDPEPVRIYGDELYTPTGDCVGVSRDFFASKEKTTECPVPDCVNGKVNQARNRHYEDWYDCETCEGAGTCIDTTTSEKSGGKRWVMPNHNTTLLLRALPDNPK